MTSSNLTVLTGDNWSGASSSDWEISQPSVEDIRMAIDRMDERQFTIVMLEYASGQLVIGGGAGRYVVYNDDQAGHFMSLTGASVDTTRELVNIGGQPGDYQRRRIVDKAMAVQAALRFAQFLDADPSLQWESDPTSA